MLWIDSETFNTKDIRQTGTYEYARTSELLLVPFAFDDGPVQLWDRTKHLEPPDRLEKALRDPEVKLTAHHAMFDRAVLGAQGFLEALDPARWTCTMCNAYLHGFTGSLDKLSGIFGLGSDQAKIKDGKKLINRFCKPAPKNHKANRYTAKTHPVEWERFCDYAKRDIVAMRIIADKLPSWNYVADEYLLDQTINDRGFQVDFELAEAGRRAAIIEKDKLATRFVELTNGDVASPTQRALFLAYLNERFGLNLENTQRATLEPLLKNDTDPVLAELIEISINANKTSTSKYAALIPAMSPDGRFRGGLQYSGAPRTRRWCLTGEHEVLTNDGWLRLDEWTGGVIAQWCNGNIVFDQADRVVFDYQGEVLSVHRKGRIDAVMTPEHVLCATGQTGRQTAGSAFGRHVTGVERYGVLRRKPISTIRTRVMVMLQHDGYVAGSTVEWNFVKKRKSTRCQKLLACAGIRFTASQKANGVYRVHIPVGAKPNWLIKRDFGPWLLQEKHCPRAFIDEIGYWDGGNRRDKQIEVCAKAKVNAEWTVTMAHLAGFSGTLSRRANGYWFANISKSGNRASIKPADWSLKHHQGKVYCAATRTGYFLTRRNGVIHVTGNSGRTFQPQNLPSRDAPNVRSIENYIDALKHDCHDFLFDGDLMRYGSHALRGVLIAPPGQKLCVADLANIEGRANAWLAGEMWKLKAFEAYDRGNGPDLYKVAAGKILGKRPRDVTKNERDSFGKITELALGYQGGVGAVQNFASNRGVAFADHWDNIKQSVDPALIDRAYYNYETWGRERAGDLDENEWIASETVKLSWRAGHPAISRLWYECENAALDAMNNPGDVFSAGWTLKFRYVRYNDFNYLLMRMPSKRALVYFQPSIDHEGKITYWGVDSVTKQWKRQGIYGGKFVENACQSLSRDILVHGMFEAEKRGYRTVLTVHDEVVTECPNNDDFTGDGLVDILANGPEWCAGFPLAAEGFEAYRYRK